MEYNSFNFKLSLSVNHLCICIVILNNAPPNNTPIISLLYSAEALISSIEDLSTFSN